MLSFKNFEKIWIYFQSQHLDSQTRGTHKHLECYSHYPLRIIQDILLLEFYLPKFVCPKAWAIPITCPSY